MEIPIDDELIAQLALNRVSGIGSLAFSNLLQSFGSASAVFSANRQQLLRIPDVAVDSIDLLVRGVEASNVERLMN